MASMTKPMPAPFATLLGRALRLRCPNCGTAPLFRAYLKQVEACPSCGEAYGHLRSDDAAPWLAILVTGHLVIPVVHAVESRDLLPFWASVTLWPIFALAVAMAVLPRAKAVLLAILWRTKAPGSEIR